MIRPALLATAFAAVASPASAEAYLRIDGYADGRLIAPSSEESWTDSGLGKLRWGEEDEGVRFAEAVGALHVQATPDLSANAIVRIEDYQKTFVDVMEAYVRYRPVSTSQWRWSVKAGAFFAPISLENNEVGWTSEWTLTPSAINTWVGDELRTIGAEAEVEYRSEARTVSAFGSAYGYNDPAGVLIAFRGWIFEDRPSTLIERERLPDALATSFGGRGPIYANEYSETDGRLGWYAGINWEESGFGSARVLYYDNRADPDSVHNDNFGWRTKFWSVGVQTGYEDFVVLAQAMWGDTAVGIGNGEYSVTDFKSAYVLAGWYLADDWRVAARADWFQNRDNYNLYDEDGHAFTFAVTWTPKEWLRFTAEVMKVVSDRSQRLFDGDPPHFDETQVQLSARVYLPNFAD